MCSDTIGRLDDAIRYLGLNRDGLSERSSIHGYSVPKHQTDEHETSTQLHASLIAQAIQMVVYQ